MNNKEIQKEWEKELNDFLEFHNEKMKDMSEEECNKYIKENQVNEKLQQLQKEFKEKHSTQK